MGNQASANLIDEVDIQRDGHEVTARLYNHKGRDIIAMGADLDKLHPATVNKLVQGAIEELDVKNANRPRALIRRSNE